MMKYLLQLLIIVFLSSCENKNTDINEIQNQDSIKCTINDDDLSKNKLEDSIVKLFSKMPNISLKSPLFFNRYNSYDKTRFIRRDNTLINYFDDLEYYDFEYNDTAEVDLDRMNVVYFLNGSKLKFQFFKLKSNKKITMCFMYINYFHISPIEYIRIYSISNDLNWKDVTSDYINKKEIYSYFEIDNDTADFQDLFNIKKMPTNGFVLYPNIDLKMKINKEEYPNAPIFSMPESKYNDSLLVHWNPDSLKYIPQY